jgi:TolA-binding protein
MARVKAEMAEMSSTSAARSTEMSMTMADLEAQLQSTANTIASLQDERERLLVSVHELQLQGHKVQALEKNKWGLQYKVH